MPAQRRKLTQAAKTVKRRKRQNSVSVQPLPEGLGAGRYTPTAMAGNHPGDSRRPPDRARLPVKAESGSPSARREETSLYFFPDANVTPSQLQRILDQGSRAERCWAISHLLRYAQWDDIWLLVTRDQVRELLPEIELPENLRTAWARILKVETPVG
jgi:hypothetical protein